MQDHVSSKSEMLPRASCDSCARGPWLLRKLVAGGLLLVVAVGLTWAWVARGNGQPTRGAGADGADSCALFDHDHPAWNAILERYVSAGSVDYAGLKRRGQADLNGYLQSLEAVCRGHFDSWTREQKLAFWINAYNAYTVKLILDNYPLSSIRSIGLLPGSAFRRDFIPLQRLRGDELSLNDIEHEILRKEFREPRIHFAVVCASKSCPVLRSEAYRASMLSAQLDDAARTFIRDTSRNRFDASTRTLHLSSIFDWFREDFERDGQSLQRFVARYADAETAAAISSGNVRVRFLDYDWSLNGR